MSSSPLNSSILNSNNTTPDTVNEVRDPLLLSDDIIYYFRVIHWATVCKGISIFGVISNTINMIVFRRSGFKDSINLSLFALAVSDFGSCFTLLLSNVAMNPEFQNRVASHVSWDEIQYIVSLWTHVGFTKITTLITAFITFERCLCVSSPLKVKSIITRGRVKASLVMCYVFVVMVMAPMYYANPLGYKFYPHINKTLFGIVFRKNRAIIESVMYPILNAFLSVFAFVFIIVSTIVLVVALNKKSKWRMKATTSSMSAAKEATNRESSTTKEQKISKMVVGISTLFIVCFVPSVALQLYMWADRRVSIDGEYFNLALIISYFAFSSEALNSALNIVIYYRNSSNYKAVFDQMFYSNKNQK